MRVRTDYYPTGRKNCSRCGAWKHLYEFYRANKASGGDGFVLQAWCSSCQTEYRRAKRGHKPRRIDQCKRGHRFTPENTGRQKSGSRYCKTCAKERQRAYYSNPMLREYERIRQEVGRRKKGIKPRQFTTRKTPANGRWPHRVPAGPFRDWVKERIEWVDCTQEDFAQRIGMNTRRLHDLMHGKQDRIHIDTVDKALIRELGSPYLLNELYPWEDEDE